MQNSTEKVLSKANQLWFRGRVILMPYIQEVIVTLGILYIVLIGIKEFTPLLVYSPFNFDLFAIVILILLCAFVVMGDGQEVEKRQKTVVKRLPYQEVVIAALLAGIFTLLLLYRWGSFPIVTVIVGAIYGVIVFFVLQGLLRDEA